MADISKITLPSGNTYEIKDAVARQMISGGVSFIVAWDGTAAPVVANIPEGVQVKYNGTTYTGTLDPEDAQAGAFYLVKSSTTPTDETLDIYDEYVPAGTTGVKFWEKIGDTQLNLTDVVKSVSLNKSTDTVIGTDATFTITQPTITLAEDSTNGNVSYVKSGTTKYMKATASGTAVTPSTTNIKATASGGGAAWNSKDSKTVVTGYTIAAANKDTFVKSVSAETGKNLVTTSITPTNGTETVSKVTKTASKLVTTSITPTNGTETVSKVTKTASKLVTTTVPNVTGNSDVGASNITSNSSVTANKSTWSFTMGSGDAAETLIIGGGNGSDVTATNTAYSAVTASKVTLGTAKTVATGAVDANGSGSDVVTGVTVSDKTVAKVGTATTVATGSVDANGTGSDVVTGVTVSDKTVAKQGSAITVATGATSTTGTGDAVVTGVTVGESADAIVSLPSPSTASVIGASSTFTNTQPTVALSTGATAGTGVISVATGISSVTQPTVALAAEDSSATGRAEFVQGVTTSKIKGTASGANTAWNSKDSVTVLKSDTSLSVTKGNE